MSSPANGRTAAAVLLPSNGNRSNSSFVPATAAVDVLTPAEPVKKSGTIGWVILVSLLLLGLVGVILWFTVISKPAVADLVCLNGGRVKDGKCVCLPGFSGTLCQTNACDGIVCANDGKCVAGACVCDSSFKGTRCETSLYANGWVGCYILPGVSIPGGYQYITGLDPKDFGVTTLSQISSWDAVVAYVNKKATEEAERRRAAGDTNATATPTNYLAFTASERSGGNGVYVFGSGLAPCVCDAARVLNAKQEGRCNLVLGSTGSFMGCKPDSGATGCDKALSDGKRSGTTYVVYKTK